MQKLVVLTGAGMSAESGISTFRDNGGLWDQYRVEDVATPEGWQRNPQLVTDFYNGQREKLLMVRPNAGHLGLARLEEKYDVRIITQNIDDLHERAGSSHIVHLHGELTKMRGCVHEDYVVALKPEEYRQRYGAKTPYGDLLRPHIVWFGEAVPMIEPAIELTQQADIYVVIGSSLQVYPAAGLVHYLPQGVPLYVIDPKEVPLPSRPNVHFLQMTATKGVEELLKRLM